MSNESEKKLAAIAPQGRDEQSGIDSQSNSSFHAADGNGNRSEEDEAFVGVNARGVPVVGLGASAGGIEALTEFFDAMPAESGLAFVIVLPACLSASAVQSALFAEAVTNPASLSATVVRAGVRSGSR